MTRNALFSFLLLLLAVAAPEVQCQSLFEIRPVVDSLQPGALKLMEEESHRAVFVGGKAFFTISDVDSARIFLGKEDNGASMYAVNISFKQSLSDSMRNLTGHHIGDRLAIVLERKLLATPRILDPILTARISLSVPSEAEAKELARKINRAVRIK